ncbi:MAG: hypothetical protein WCO00_01335 [Rhodospirillaceae bacterium]
MSDTKPSAATAGGSRRTVTVDYLTAAAHPDAVVTGVLLVVIGLLLALGAIGLIEPVMSLDLFNPDLGSTPFLLTLGKVAVSVLALVAAGLGLAKHPRFPAFYLIVAFGLTLLIAADLGHWLTGAGAERPGAFPLAGLLVVLAVPYVVFSRKCRLIFRRRLDLNELKSLSGDQSWSASSAAALAPALPSFDPGRQAPAPKRTRARRSGGAAPAPAPSLSVPAAPPGDAQAAALWAALYGSQAISADKATDEGDADPAAPGGSGGKRIGLEALINLRPPGS